VTSDKVWDQVPTADEEVVVTDIPGYSDAAFQVFVDVLEAVGGWDAQGRPTASIPWTPIPAGAELPFTPGPDVAPKAVLGALVIADHYSQHKAVYLLVSALALVAVHGTTEDLEAYF